jgi:alcohol dehydrogenase, propanol-preferring
MKACRLHATKPASEDPLRWEEVPDPEPGADEIAIRVSACGVCRTDLHVVEGDLPSRRRPVIPGHQVVGRVDRLGASATRFRIGDRVGVAWLHRTCNVCPPCRRGDENLCDVPEFTGWTVDGGFAERIVAPEAFAYAIPDGFDDVSAAPLLCAGIIGHRAFRLSGTLPGGRLGLYGFGAAAHVATQIARHRGIEVFAMTRDLRHRALALELGAAWAGGPSERPAVALDAAIVFAPAGDLVPAALDAIRKAGTVVLGGIHMSPIPALDYAAIYHEKVLRSVTNATRRDGEELLALAAAIPIRTEVEVFPLAEANRALAKLSDDAIRGAAVLKA